MIHTNIKALRQQHGFTIVELLIVIVVIGILATITIISYAGVTTNAKTAKAQTNAETAQKVAEAINADNGSYPITTVAFTTGSASTHLPAGVTVGSTGLSTPTVLSASNGQTTVTFACNSAVAATAPCLGTGGEINYWNFNTSSANTVYFGVASSTSNFFAPAT